MFTDTQYSAEPVLAAIKALGQLKEVGFLEKFGIAFFFGDSGNPTTRSLQIYFDPNPNLTDTDGTTWNPSMTHDEMRVVFKKCREWGLEVEIRRYNTTTDDYDELPVEQFPDN